MLKYYCRKITLLFIAFLLLPLVSRQGILLGQSRQNDQRVDLRTDGKPYRKSTFSPPQALTEDGQSGISCYLEYRFDDALGKLKAAVSKKPDDAVAWFFLGLTLMKMGKPEQVIMALQKAASLKPEPSFWYNLGQNFRKAFHSAEEEQAYYAALQANPKFAPALAGLAYLALLKSDYDKATATAREALAADSQDAEAHYIIGVGRLNGGSFADAMNEAEAALKSHPRYAAALLLKYQAMLGQWVKGREERSAQDSLQYLKSLQTVLEDGVKLGDELEEAELWQEQLKLLNRMADRFTSADASAKSEQNAVSIKSLTQKPRLTYKEKAKYTEEARQAQVQGVVALQLLISAEGQVKDILVVRLLSHGLTIKAVEAAHSMKFEPGMKDGQRVAVLVNVEFSFNIY